MSNLDRHSITPLYYQLAQYLREQIHSGKLAHGTLVPSERELMEQFRLSRNTVRQCMDVLAKEGLVVRTLGHGTSVSNLPSSFHYMLNTFLENGDLLRCGGYAPSVEQISSEVVAPPEQVLQALGLDAGATTVCNTLVFHADGRPAMFTRDYLPYRPGADFEFRLQGETYLQYLDRVSGLSVGNAMMDIVPIEAAGEVADTFKCAVGSPVLLLKELFLDTSQTVPIAYSLNYFNRELVNFRLLSRRA